MNAPMSPDAARQALAAVSIDDKYALESGRAYMSGVQALVRLPLLQRRRDAAAGHSTAGFISGYRGSPLGSYDQALWQARRHLADSDVVFKPGVNEELGVTAVWGSQQLEFDAASKKFDGVFGIWYGKGPGVDRSGDALKHANLAGTAPLGGVIALAGDDHVSKSSTLAHQSDHTFMACGLPVFFPANVQDILDLGVHAFAMSRFSGLWSGMKTVQEVVESGASVVTDADRVRIVLPEDFTQPHGGLHIRWPDDPLAAEARMMEFKWPAALAYVRANRLNRNVIEGPDDRLGIIASGKAYSDTRQALLDLGLDDATCRALGVRLHKVSVVWPLEPDSVRDFARGLREVLVVEEKRPVIEQQLKDELYHYPAAARPAVFGKYHHADGTAGNGGEWSHRKPAEDWLLRAKADLSPALVAKAIALRLKALGVPADVAARMDRRLQEIAAGEQASAQGDSRATDRLPWFCPGCPHNTSTLVPEGSVATAGIGCHGMVVWMDRSTTSWSQMGGEGVHWMGQAPFSKRAHMFANLGDGTYNHSGLLAVRQSIHAGVNLTYKILFNSAVAMTGGQPVDGQLDVPAMTRELAAEGARQIVVVTDEPGKYKGAGNLAAGVTVRHRDELDTVQRELREVAGVTVIIYDQACATKKRRERKRGTMADPARRVVINELVCEGCGDCSVQSNCLAVQPVETDFGRKRKVNQDTCNKDFSCTKGFCPSFVTVEGGRLKKPAGAAGGKATPPAIPMPALPDASKPRRIVVAGIGGTGIVTIGGVLGMAAHLEGKGVITQDATGMAQMGGATWSHIQIAASPDALHASRVDLGMADLVIACDTVVAASKASLAAMSPARTYVVLNSHLTPTAAFMRNPDWDPQAGEAVARIARAVGTGQLASFDAEQVAKQLLGQSIFANLLLLGHAWQQGKVPLSHAALMRAIELNGVQVDSNKAAFEWGRVCAHDISQLPSQLQSKLPSQPAGSQVIQFVRKVPLEELVRKHAEFLAGYQNGAYAAQYESFVSRVRAAESLVGGTRLSEAVARSLFKLMAYKDEYEVARLHTGAAFREQIASMFEGKVRLVHHLAPPLLARRNKDGEPVKGAYGPWMRHAFGVLARLRGLRGTPLDPFGYTQERKQERALIGEYRRSIEALLPALSAHNLELALEIARLPQEIRGYGHVKARNLAATRTRWERLMAQWHAGDAQAPARTSAAA
ncbi:indolepyruvate ferredoxin oxidoreductase family protein [Cupriavidus consociatus]|uniref:indolepyruvate ferredoxin oxidoreductase family protein n=1 Tax=Cupriavidus consociatus TaxID=2821357 RepID=UPI001AE9C66F|nr:MULTISPECIES: indolepyruvate ferredoxin oxidoreductase family protein [unclassified Cupriavidus]MBP0619629.1 indolepyruvate ferredoxin oxidoreductase family protein [Cupriavidus sp. LEh25]MDK2656279.1 indolepyruvate ferredoxin oxidoreductase family protein [Cupriavidus sp. LEh21]